MEAGDKNLLDVYAVRCAAEDQACSHSFCESSGLVRYLFLIFSREIDKVIVFRANKKRNRSLVESSALTIPLLDTVQRALPRKVEHE